MADAQPTTILPTKAFYKQKRFWFGIGAIILAVFVYAWIFQRDPREVFKNLIDGDYADLIAAVLGIPAMTLGAYLATLRGAMGTAASTKSERQAIDKR